MSKIFLAVIAAGLMSVASHGSARTMKAPEVIQIWTGHPPGSEAWTGDEIEGDFPGPAQSTVHYVGNVTVPTLTVIRPAPGKSNGTGVIVCPGGGFQILSIRNEGMDVAAMLAARGYTAFVLKYRVRTAASFNPQAAQNMTTSEFHHTIQRFDELARLLTPARRIAIADGIQAVHLLRSEAKRFGLDPGRIGMIGFSAGAMTTMGVVTDSQPSDRPNFAAPIYGSMDDSPVPNDGPPLFVAAAQNDSMVPALKSAEIFSRWFAAGLPAELHVYEKGGHGFGAASQDLPIDDWAASLFRWMSAHGWDKRR